MNKEKIMNKIEEKKAELRSRGVRKIGLFGSYLKGEEKKGSDIDLLVTLDKNTLDRHFKLHVYLERLLKRKVDLIIEESLRSELGYVKKEVVYVEI